MRPHKLMELEVTLKDAIRMEASGFVTGLFRSMLNEVLDNVTRRHIAAADELMAALNDEAAEKPELREVNLAGRKALMLLVEKMREDLTP